MQSDTLIRIELLLEQLRELDIGIKCCHRIMERSGIPGGTKLHAVADVLRVAAARADGGDAAVSALTMKVLHVISADAETRILWDRLGLKRWGPA